MLYVVYRVLCVVCCCLCIMYRAFYVFVLMVHSLIRVMRFALVCVCHLLFGVGCLFRRCLFHDDVFGIVCYVLDVVCCVFCLLWCDCVMCCVV